MRPHRFRILALALVLALLASCAYADNPDLDTKINKILRKAAGGVVVVAKDGQIVYEHAAGTANKKDRTPLTPDHYIKIASVTKFVTGIGMMRLVEEGKIGLDDPIGDTLEVKNLYYPKIPVTLRHLMSHTSSLRAKGGFTKTQYRLDDFLPASLKRKGEWMDREPGSKYEYSNFGAGIMGSLIEAATEQNINDYMTEAVFAPLGMDAAYHASLLSDPSLVTSSYKSDGSIFVSAKVALERDWDAKVDPYGHYRITIGSVWMRARDLCRLGLLMLNGGELDGVRLLREETVEEMLSSQLGKPNITVDSPYGLCVNRNNTLTKDHRMFYGHQGMTDGNAANLYFDPQSGFVFAFISNGMNMTQNDRVLSISRRLFSACWEVYGDPATQGVQK